MTIEEILRLFNDDAPIASLAWAPFDSICERDGLPPEYLGNFPDPGSDNLGQWKRMGWVSPTWTGDDPIS